MSSFKNANNHIGTMSIDWCRIYGHNWETLALGEIVCHRCGAVHRQHQWQDMSNGSPVRMFCTGPEDNINEQTVCVICGMNKADFDHKHTVPQGQEIP